MGWKAVTESGRVYERIRAGVKVQGVGYFPNADVSVVDRDTLAELESVDAVWAYLRNLPAEDTPVVGKSLFISTFGDAGWRLSRNLVSVEETDD